MSNIKHLALSTSVSRGQDTYGYTIVRLDDRTTGKRFKCMGGGYDMVGTVFADWLECEYQEELKGISNRAHSFCRLDGGISQTGNSDALYGMRVYFSPVPQEAYNAKVSRVSLDGACGIESMIRIAEALGLEVQREADRKGRTIGFYVEYVRSV